MTIGKIFSCIQIVENYRAKKSNTIKDSSSKHSIQSFMYEHALSFLVLNRSVSKQNFKRESYLSGKSGETSIRNSSVISPRYSVNMGEKILIENNRIVKRPLIRTPRSKRVSFSMTDEVIIPRKHLPNISREVSTINPKKVLEKYRLSLPDTLNNEDNEECFN